MSPFSRLRAGAPPRAGLGILFDTGSGGARGRIRLAVRPPPEPATLNKFQTFRHAKLSTCLAKFLRKRGDLCTNPITGEQFIYGHFSIKREKEAAYRRLLVREYFALNGPADAPLLRIDEWDRDRAKHQYGPLGFITAHFMWSMESQDDLRVHPSFAEFAAGLLWLHDNVGGPCEKLPGTPEQLSQIKEQYPPRPLEGLHQFRWYSPKRWQKLPKKIRRAA